MKLRVGIALLSVLIILMVGTLTPWANPATVTNAASQYGYYDDNLPYFYTGGSGSKSIVHTPSGEKPQSKLWFNDGIWWGSLFNSTV